MFENIVPLINVIRLMHKICTLIVSGKNTNCYLKCSEWNAIKVTQCHSIICSVYFPLYWNINAPIQLTAFSPGIWWSMFTEPFCCGMIMWNVFCLTMWIQENELIWSKTSLIWNQFDSICRNKWTIRHIVSSQQNTF